MLDLVLIDPAIDARLRPVRSRAARSWGWTLDPQSSARIVDLRVLEPQDRLERGVHVELVGLEVPVPDADGAGGGGQRVACCALAKSVLGSFVFR